MKRIKRSPLPWYVEKCNSEDCWCRIIVSKKGSDKMKDCVIPSGAISKADAEFIVKVVNKYGDKIK
jgi:hypothetical protein